jgi:hypothetical protein
MPRLLIFAPCHRVIFSQEDNLLSLIDLMQEITVTVGPGTPKEFPPGEALPLQWYCLSLWYGEADDIGKKYEQTVRLISGEGHVLMEPPIQAWEFANPEHRVSTHFMGFPLHREGALTVRLYLREVGLEDWQEIFSYPLSVKLDLVTEPPKEPVVLNRP